MPKLPLVFAAILAMGGWGAANGRGAEPSELPGTAPLTEEASAPSANQQATATLRGARLGGDQTYQTYARSCSPVRRLVESADGFPVRRCLLWSVSPMHQETASAVPGEFGRRRFLQWFAAGAAAGAARLPCFAAGASDEGPLVIDCHAHIYGEDENRYPTIEKPYRPPQGKGTISHLRREMHDAGVRYVTTVQTSTYYRWDNHFTADSATTTAISCWGTAS